MKIVYSELHRLRDAKTELCGGALVPPFESPKRAEIILAHCRARQIGDVVEPPPSPSRPDVLAVHDADYLEFLEHGWRQWQAAGHIGEMLPNCWPSRAMPRQMPPRDIEGRVGYYALAGETSISDGTWRAAQAAASCALTGASLLADGEKAAFALCRPPGHHAARDMYGGYCFINNAAVAAQSILAGGAARVALLDVDFHHGNGTQQIFYRRRDVLFLSLHGDPQDTFPYYLGYADETGDGAGDGYNVNLPMPPATEFPRWRAALSVALERVRQYAPDALVVSLGVDTFHDDPISFFKLQHDDFLRYGEDIGGLGFPTLFVMEGGYALDALGVNAVNVLEGFEAGRA